MSEIIHCLNDCNKKQSFSSREYIISDTVAPTKSLTFLHDYKILLLYFFITIFLSRPIFYFKWLWYLQVDVSRTFCMV